MGIWTGSTERPNRLCSPSSARPKSARSRSILVRLTITGSSSSAADFQTFSVLTSTPATPLTQSSAASAARRPCWVSVKKMP